MQKILSFILALLLFAHFGPHEASAAADLNPYEECLLEALKNAKDSDSVRELRDSCSKKSTPTKTEDSAGTPETCDKPKPEKKADGIAFHNPTYFLASYNTNPSAKGLGGLGDSGIDREELKYQLSFKVPIPPIPVFSSTPWLNGKTGRFYIAYTIKSFWQILNGDISRPFRETNHEPEFFYELRSNRELYGFQEPAVRAGFSHQSNGRGGEFSRSWNRIYLYFILPQGDFTFFIKPWYRLPESQEKFIGDPYGDDNPDISSYMGYGELSAQWRINSSHTIDIMLRNNHNRGAVEFDWTFPWFWPLPKDSPIKGYFQYFNGYGESMIDYNSSINRFGLGVRLID